MTTEQIIVAYLKYKLNGDNSMLLAGHSIETDIPNFARIQFGILHTPGTYSRAFRALRENNKIHQHKLSIEVAEKQAKENYYKITKLI